MVVLEAADEGKVYVHRALLNGEIAAFRKCGWSCFPSATVTSFAEYLYQGDYISPSAVITLSAACEAWDAPLGSIWGAAHSEVGWDASSTGQERREENLPYYTIGQVNANPSPPQTANLLTTKMFSSPTLGYSYSPDTARYTLSQACALKGSWRL